MLKYNGKKVRSGQLSNTFMKDIDIVQLSRLESHQYLQDKLSFIVCSTHNQSPMIIGHAGMFEIDCCCADLEESVRSFLGEEDFDE